MLSLVVMMIAVATTRASQDSSDSCSVSAYVDRMCEGNIISVSHATKCNELVPKSETSDQPTVQWNNANKNANYTIVMADPDAPNAEKDTRFWIHWLLADVTGQSLIDGSVGGKTLFEYKAPSPPSGTHRYQFYIFVSTGHDVRSSQKSRGGFSLDDFAEENNLCSVVARFQYRVKSDS